VGIEAVDTVVMEAMEAMEAVARSQETETMNDADFPNLRY
jgi:hypothetical protein